MPHDSNSARYCAKHHCRADDGCQVPRCTFQLETVELPNQLVIPESPQACPRCSKPGKPVYCERDVFNSTRLVVRLKCPHCSWQTNPLSSVRLTPEQARRQAMREQARSETIGARMSAVAGNAWRRVTGHVRGIGRSVVDGGALATQDNLKLDEQDESPIGAPWPAPAQLELPGDYHNL